MLDARHHHAHAPAVIVVPVPIMVPYEIGSNKVLRQIKPPSYPSDRREAWRPARAIPGRRGKAAALQRFLDYMQRQDEIVREFMRPDAAAMQAWLNRGAA